MESRGGLPEEDRERAAAYLRKGAVFSASGGMFKDWFTGEQVIAHHTQTDGVWMWPADLPHYVERHATALPEELLQRMRDLEWKCPVLTRQELIALSEEFFEFMRKNKKKNKG
ncbi:hypothetical protein [Cystobacter ferrugineus]|uniref:hypothetical protein n=1 Tax=Cystobacter ferrugineus TaxID=83449 RepID=UPI0011612790|nr:hypothetical protein [Cystobacter ferrugineus]